MISESGLCVELLQEIASLTSPEDQKALRAVSRHLRWAIEPLFFASAHIILDLSRPAERLLPWLEALATGDTGFSHISRTLVIHCDEWRSRNRYASGGPAADPRVQALLRPALQSLKAIHTVYWTVEKDQDWADAIVVDFLATTPTIEDLTLRNEPNRTNIWTTLQAHHVELKAVHIVSVTDTLLLYLASYSGLERLMITYPTDEYGLGEFFWARVIPQHAHSLVALACPGVLEGVWAFGTHNIAAISELRHLEVLIMTLNTDERGTGPLKAMARAFLEMAVRMPALRDIAMLAARPPRELRFYHSHCGMRMLDYLTAAQRQIDEAVDSFGAAHQSPAVAQLIESHSEIRRGRAPNLIFILESGTVALGPLA
ncbi:hypothetical protein FB451DRAFT_355066 [Mycena latifolia]|nr:hypothetical protein FB451DRAFT_355066 [Mycena latifolia]